MHRLECFYLLENFRPDATGGKKKLQIQSLIIHVLIIMDVMDVFLYYLGG